MELEKTVMDDKQMLFELPKEAGQLQIVKGKLIETKDNTVLLAIKEGQLLSVADEKTFDDKQEYDRLMILTPPWEIMAPYLAAYYQEKYHLSNASNAPIVIPQELQQGVAVCAESFDCLIDFLGYVSTSKKETKAVKKGGKPRHKWSKELQDEPFMVDYQGSTATVYWQKRNEVRIEKGATLRQEVPLNKDGSVGFSARLAEKIRQENQSAIKEGRTIEDVVLKSVNEVGMFLYYGGTNGWLQLKDQQGRTLNERTVE